MLDLTTLDDLRARLIISDDESSAELEDLIDCASHQIEAFLGRNLLRTTYTEYLDTFPGLQTVQVRGFPITAITSIKEDVMHVFGSGTVIAATSYWYGASGDNAGLIHFASGTIVGNPYLCSGYSPAALQVVYTGGMAASTSALKAAYPDVAEAALRQAAFLWNTKRHIGALGVTAAGGSVQWQSDGALLKEVRDMLEPYRL